MLPLHATLRFSVWPVYDCTWLVRPCCCDSCGQTAWKRRETCMVRHWLCCWPYHSLQNRSTSSLRHSYSGWLLGPTATMVVIIMNIFHFKIYNMNCYKLMCVSCLSPARTDQLLKYDDGSFFTVEPQHRRDFCMLILKLIQVISEWCSYL